MATNTPVSNANWNSKLAGIKRGGVSLSENVQYALIFAMDSFVNCTTEGAECHKLSQLRDTVHNTRGLNVKKFDAYVVEHTNATRGKNKSGQMIFKLKKGEKASVTAPTIKWDEQSTSATRGAAEPMTLDKYRDRIRKDSERGADKATMHAQCAATLLAAYMDSKQFDTLLTKAVAERKAAMGITVEEVKD